MAAVSIAYLPMRVFGISTVILLSIVHLGWSQVDVPSSQTAKLPMYRPILLGTGPDALVNRIDTAGLIQQGQGRCDHVFLLGEERRLGSFGLDLSGHPRFKIAGARGSEETVGRGESEIYSRGLQSHASGRDLL